MSQKVRFYNIALTFKGDNPALNVIIVFLKVKICFGQVILEEILILDRRNSEIFKISQTCFEEIGKKVLKCGAILGKKLFSIKDAFFHIL